MQKTSPKTFGKAERLHRKKDIQELFDKGSSFYIHPLRILFMPASGGEVHQVLVTVSRRLFKRATDRNRIKRLIREAYRQHKYLLDGQTPLCIGYIYTKKEIPEYSTIEKSVIRGMERLIRESAP